MRLTAATFFHHRWFEKDFVESSDGTVLNFINSHASFALDSNVNVEYFSYDWGLNAKT